MNLKQLAVAGAVAAACSGAWADDVSVSFSLAANSQFFGALHFEPTSFTDTFTFTASTGSFTNATGSLVSIALVPGVLQDIDITSATLYSGPSFSVASAFTSVSTGAAEVRLLTGTGAIVGPLKIVVEGTATGVGGGTAASYSGTLNVVPVPEPETYALMLAGLGAIGFMARRRRNS